MELTVIEGLPTLKLDLVMTLAAAAVALLTGQYLQRRLRLLARYSIPSPIVGGLLFALLALVLRAQNVFSINIDTTLRAPLQTIFFTTIGLGATLSLLRAGGWQLPFFLLIASLTAVVQNAVGVLTAVTLGVRQRSA
ncbi:MAG: sodium/glutamate symporter [Pyrinomonadaceae bacterium]